MLNVGSKGDFKHARLKQARRHAQVHLEARAEDQRRLFAHVPDQFVLQFQVDIESAVEEAGAGATGGVFVKARLEASLMRGRLVRPK
jgi:hypothetical protein